MHKIIKKNVKTDGYCSGAGSFETINAVSPTGIIYVTGKHKSSTAIGFRMIYPYSDATVTATAKVPSIPVISAKA